MISCKEHIYSLRKDIDSLNLGAVRRMPDNQFLPFIDYSTESLDSADVFCPRETHSPSMPDLTVCLETDKQIDLLKAKNQAGEEEGATALSDNGASNLNSTFDLESSPGTRRSSDVHDCIQSNKRRSKVGRKCRVGDIGRQKAVTFVVEQNGRGRVKRMPTPYPRDADGIFDHSDDEEAETLKIIKIMRARRTLTCCHDDRLDVPRDRIALIASTAKLDKHKTRSAPNSPMIGRSSAVLRPLRS